MTNREFSKSKDFINTCKEYGIKSTKRQASKYQNKKGILYNMSCHIKHSKVSKTKKGRKK